MKTLGVLDCGLPSRFPIVRIGRGVNGSGDTRTWWVGTLPRVPAYSLRDQVRSQPEDILPPSGVDFIPAVLEHFQGLPDLSRSNELRLAELVPHT